MKKMCDTLLGSKMFIFLFVIITKNTGCLVNRKESLKNYEEFFCIIFLGKLF